MLLLIVGMPVAMSDHIDRRAGKRILRGRVGRGHTWICADKEKFVQRRSPHFTIFAEGCIRQLSQQKRQPIAMDTSRIERTRCISDRPT